MTRSSSRINRKIQPPKQQPPALWTGKPQSMRISVGPVPEGGKFAVRLDVGGFASEDEAKAWAYKLKEWLAHHAGAVDSSPGGNKS